MKNDYLWDKTASPDPEIERLERLLGRFASVPPVPALPRQTVRWRSAPTLAPILATAAAVIIMIALAWRTPFEPGRTWTVSAVEGQPRIGEAALATSAEGQIAVGDLLVTDPASTARIAVGDIGEVTIRPNSRVRMVSARKAHHRLALDRGAMRAFIWAPPGQFYVDTPSAIAVDLGCLYNLTVEEDGSGMLSVEIGWVGFEANGRESFVPAHASCPTRPRLGPGTPRYDDADAALKEALDAFDFGEGKMDADFALRTILERARPRDAFTLWHLLARTQGAERARVYDALAARVPPPQGVTRDAVMRLDRAATDRWWNALGLDKIEHFRKWKKNPF